MDMCWVEMMIVFRGLLWILKLEKAQIIKEDLEEASGRRDREN